MSETGVQIGQIGRYRIASQLGRGGMGIVYRGEDPLIGREVAIKTLTETTPELRERFYMEARSGILNHPNIVTVYELGEHEGAPFIAMEYVAGDSLEAILRARKRLLLLEALSIVEQLCAGLGHAHSHGVVHRDVKPANVLIRQDGLVTIVDFGIARLADQTRQLTKTDALLGTFHYIAPERLKGEACDGRADIWSVGVMLYEMLAGELPFQGKDVSSLYRVMHEPYMPLEKYVPDMPNGLSRILDRALAKDVDARYSTAEEMAFDLQVIASALKQERLQSLLERARRLTDEHEYASARTVVLQAQRLDPSNREIKRLAQAVQERLSQLLRGEQLRQIVEQAQNATAEKRFEDAIGLWEQARKLDSEDAFGINERLQHVSEQRSQQQQVESFWQQASEARRQGNFTAAQQHLAQALAIDDKNTDLRSAYALLVREAEKKQGERQLAELLQSARENIARAKYTEAIAHLREAAEINPAHNDVQQLLFSATKRHKEELRQRALESLIAEIQESLHRDNFAQATERVQRALQTLPTEGALVRLKAEAEMKAREHAAQQIVRSTLLKAQDLFADAPEQALRITDEALKHASENQALLQLQARLHAHLQELEEARGRAAALEHAHASTARGRPAEARKLLQEAKETHGASEDLDLLLTQLAAQEVDAKQKAEHDAAVASIEQLLRERKWSAAEEAVTGLREKNDPRAPALLERAQRKQQQWNAAVHGKLAKIQTLADIDHAAALRALSELPPAMKAEPRVRALSKEIRSRKKEKVRLNVAISVTKQKGVRRHTVLYGGGALGLGCVIAGGMLTLRRHAAPPPPPPPHAVAPAKRAPIIFNAAAELDASPWATVISARMSGGAVIPLPAGAHTTPLRLDGLQPGMYSVVFERTGQPSQTVTCDVGSGDQICPAHFEALDIDRALKGQQP